MNSCFTLKQNLYKKTPFQCYVSQHFIHRNVYHQQTAMTTITPTDQKMSTDLKDQGCQL